MALLHCRRVREHCTMFDMVSCVCVCENYWEFSCENQITLIILQATFCSHLYTTQAERLSFGSFYRLQTMIFLNGQNFESVYLCALFTTALSSYHPVHPRNQIHWMFSPLPSTPISTANLQHQCCNVNYTLGMLLFFPLRK